MIRCYLGRFSFAGMLLLILCGVSFATDQGLAATVRVLVKFDSDGHQIIRVLRLSAEGRAIEHDRDADPATAENDAKSTSRDAQRIAQKIARRQFSVRASKDAALGILADRATATWRDNSGAALLSEYLSDPRIVHAPQLGARQSEQPTDFSRKNSGVYLLTGPADAVEVRVMLPATELFGQVQPAEMWVMNIP